MLVISLTLATFGIMVVSSVRTAQAAAAWQQVGADVMITTSGNGVAGPAAQRAVAAVRGVRRTAAVYVTPEHGVFAGDLKLPGRRPRVVALILGRPAPYAALAEQTPWPDFPAAALARGGGRAVPVLVSAAAGGGTGTGTLELDGTGVPVRAAGTIGATPAVPGGGPFVVLPAWALPDFPSIPGPNTLLVAGTHVDLPALRAAAARTMPLGQVTSRAQVLGALASSPAQQAAARLYELGSGAAVALSLIALLFGLAVSARSRALLIERLTALGMASGQSRALAIAEVTPLLSVAILGTLIAGAVLAVVVSPVLNLAVFTGSAAQVPVRPGTGMLLPAAGIVVVAVAVAAAQAAAFGRRDVAAALRHEEAE